jgi:mRNA-degrading endonuclease RelE of RelBE toxin-antitoxin system
VSWSVIVTGPARRDLRRLDHQTAARVKAALERLAATGTGDVVRLKGPDPEWRLRVGEWRVRLVLHYDTQQVEVLRVLPRGRAYRD